MMKQLFLVALGGGVGSALRYLTSCLIMKNGSSGFPLATFVVNILGCFIIGILLSALNRSPFFNEYLNLLLIVGFCGGYTTFSTFSAENVKLLETGNYMVFALYTITSVMLGITALYGGNVLYRMLA